MPYDEVKEEKESGGYARERGKSSKKAIYVQIGKKFEEMMVLCEKLKESDDASDDD